MILEPPVIHFPDMAKDRNTVAPVSFRPDVEIAGRATRYIEAFKEKHGVKLTFSQIMRIALSEYFDRREPDLGITKPKPAKPPKR